MPSFFPRRFDWTSADEREAVERAREIEKSLRSVSLDCIAGVLRARVQKVDTRSPHPHYL